MNGNLQKVTNLISNMVREENVNLHAELRFDKVEDDELAMLDIKGELEETILSDLLESFIVMQQIEIDDNSCIQKTIEVANISAEYTYETLYIEFDIIYRYWHTTYGKDPAEIDEGEFKDSMNVMLVKNHIEAKKVQ